MSSTPKKALGMGCLVLFALPFAGVGVVMSVLTVRSLLYWNNIQDWVETPCTVVEASLKENRDDDGSTYEAVAQYKYQWAGKEYECDVVGVHGGSDNIGSFHQDKAKELKKYQRSDKPFRCFVNPSDPTEAIVYRELRVGMLAFKAMFGLIFGGVGFGMFVGGIWGAKRAKRQTELKQIHPGEPWLCRDDWSSGRIRSSRWGPVIAMAAFALIWNLISWTAAGAFFFGGEEMPIWVVAICVGFPVLGLFMLGFAIYLAVGAARWSGSEFELAAVPGVIGGRLAGVIHAPAGLELAERFLLTLTCFKKTTRTTSDGTETTERSVWQTDQEIVETLGGDQTNKTVIPVSFYVPYDQHPTDEDAGYSWKLEATAEVPGVDYRAQFEVPIFKTADSSAEAPSEDELLAEFAAPRSFESALSRAGGRLLSQTSSRCDVLFPMARNLSMALGMGLFAAGWTGVSVGLLFSDAFLILKIVFLAFDVGILGITLWIWFEKVSLSFGSDGVEVQGGLLGLGKRRRFEQREIKAIVAEPSGTRSGSTVYQRITLKTHIGDAEKLVSGIKRRSDAQTIAAKIEEKLGLSEAEEEKPFSLEMELPEGESPRFE